MVLKKIDRLALYSELKKQLAKFTSTQVEDGIMAYCLKSYSCDASEYSSEASELVEKKLKAFSLTTDLETIVELFESLVEEGNKDTNGIVFTPKYITNYIITNVFNNCDEWNENLSIIDPSCGCGIFLISSVEYIYNRFGVDVDTIIQRNIYGIELDASNARRCNLVIKLLSAKYSGNYKNIKTNIICADSLKCSWNDSFGVKGFDYIVGNPPYVNPHGMNIETIKFLKQTFITTKNGTFNIFYAFIEHAMKFLQLDGVLGYIIPNNFLTIKSALKLRSFLQENSYVKKLIDFGDNMVFLPIRTYSCIMFLSRKQEKSFKYYVIPKSKNLKLTLQNIKFNEMNNDNLDKNGWKLVDEKTHRNLIKIESKFISIKDFIRTGIATLRDNVYLVEHDSFGYYKIVNDQKFYIEDGLVKPIYKVSDLKLHNDIKNAKRYIIFPYVKLKSEYTLISENELQKKYPKTYQYLKSQKETLDSRDKGKKNVQGWYAYGRSQGLNKYGNKLLFPTFSNRPKFKYVDNDDALFCNGYAIFENDYVDLEVLLKVLNSTLMDYYIKNTSYSIEGGYYCYQKKYIERFSLPWFTEKELSFIRQAPEKELDDFLWDLYNLE